MLYSKDFDSIGWEDIDNFCEERHAESVRLDYKEDFPKNLAKTIAAMANTVGGVILIGVAETDDSRPELPLGGIPYQPKLAERVVNTIVDTISPPVIPEIKVCRKSDRAIILIRIHESHQSPHVISDSTEVYIRTGNRNKPEKLASLEKIEWLLQGRLRSEEFRKELYLASEKRFQGLWVDNSYQIRPPSRNEGFPKNSLFIACCPTYPRDMFATPNDMKDLLQEIQVESNSYYTGGLFPGHQSPARRIQDGYISLSKEQGCEPRFCELNCFGLYSFGTTMRVKDSVIHAASTFSVVRAYLKSAIKFYEILEYWGSIQLSFSLRNMQGSKLKLFDGIFGMHRDKISLDPELVYSKRFSITQFKDRNFCQFLESEIFQKIGWNFDLDIDSEIVDRILNS